MQDWTASTAKLHFSQVLDSAAAEPQVVYRRGKPVGVVLSYAEYTRNRHLLGQKSLAAWLADLRQIDDGDDAAPDFEAPQRRDRPDPLAGLES